MQKFRQRAIRFRSLIERADWQVKLYAISHDDTAVDLAAVAAGFDLVLGSLPADSTAGGRAGVAFMIAHRAVGMDYVTLAWWDRGNELPMRVAVREHDGVWRPAKGSESVCVWDLQVIAFERDAYVRHMMLNEDCDTVAYLAQRLHIPGDHATA